MHAATHIHTSIHAARATMHVLAIILCCMDTIPWVACNRALPASQSLRESKSASAMVQHTLVHIAHLL